MLTEGEPAVEYTRLLIVTIGAHDVNELVALDHGPVTDSENVHIYALFMISDILHVESRANQRNYSFYNDENTWTILFNHPRKWFPPYFRDAHHHHEP